MRRTRLLGKRRWLSAAVLAAAVSLSVQCQPITPADSTSLALVEAVPSGMVLGHASPDPVPDANRECIRRDPLAFLLECRARYEREIRDYRCTFTKQEQIGSELSAEQEMRVAYRESPPSVDMAWTRNAGQAARAIWIKDRWLDPQGLQQAWVRPAGALIKLLIPRIQQPIHGARASSASRRAIDEFGFRRSLDLIILYCEKAKAAGDLQLSYMGDGVVDGRPTYIFERWLPYTGKDEPYPDRLLRFHMDKEWLLPTACYSYADDAGTNLLGKYLLTDVSFNQGLSDKDFDPDLLGS